MTTHGSDVDRSAEWEELRTKYLLPPGKRSASAGRGLHHFAILSSDVERTISFYQDLLEFPLAELFENRDYKGSTHFFFDIGNGNYLAVLRLPRSRARSLPRGLGWSPPHRHLGHTRTVGAPGREAACGRGRRPRGQRRLGVLLRAGRRAARTALLPVERHVRDRGRLIESDRPGAPGDGRWPGSCAPGILVLLERGATCRTPKAGSSTTPTRTSWRRRRGCATTPTPGSAIGSRRCATPAATSCARPATRRSSSATSTRVFDRLAERHALATSTAPTRPPRSWHARTSPPPASFIAEDRPRALDLLGFSSQLLFNTFHNRRLHDWEHGGDLDLAYGVARAHNRGMVEFCSVDRRLLATCYVPLADFERAAAMADEAIGHGRGRAARRVGLPAGALAEPPRPRPGLGAGARRPASRSSSTSAAPATSSTPPTSRTGCPIPPDFHGGEENFRSVDYMGIPRPPEQTLATMIFDGVFDRFPDLRIGVIEQGAIWVPSWLRQMESAFDAFARHEERLRALRCGPRSTCAARCASRRTRPRTSAGSSPRPAPRSCLFSSDYPHVEGGRKPLERFEASLGDAAEEVRRRFYCDNFLDLMGAAAKELAA